MSPKVLAQKIERLRAEQAATLCLEKMLLERDGRDWNRGRYSSQKEHWLVWLASYPNDKSAETVYNRLNCPPMVLWLAEAAGVQKQTIERAMETALSCRRNFTSQTAAIRKVIPWSDVEARLLP